MPNCPGELVTVGLDKLVERLKKYYARGARFAKWRAVIDIGSGIPSMTAIRVNAHALARFAALCQAAQIVPIVEPEVLMDGDHDIDRCYEVTQRVLNKTFQELRVQRVALEGMILKPNMAISGKKSPKQASVQEVAEKTIRLLKACVPAAVPGIAFLSGGHPTKKRPRTSTPSTPSATCPGRLLSPMAGRYRPRRRKHGQAKRKTSRPDSARSAIARI